MKTPNVNRTSKRNQAFKEKMEASPVYGIYPGFVYSTVDNDRTGKILVHIPALAKVKVDPTSTEPPDGLFSCTWTSPFAGTTDPAAVGENLGSYIDTQKSYGLWMVPPDKGNQVLVAFGEGNLKHGYIIACLFHQKQMHMVPGMPAGVSYNDPSLLMPVAEKNKYESKLTHNDAVRPLHIDLAEAIVKQGLINDPLRGAGTSGARRESPSQVFGILTPGPRDLPKNFAHRTGGHQFVMDDNVDSRLVRLRTAGGSQLLLDDTTGIVYAINKNGTAWVELGADGTINVFSEQSINFRAKGNFNLRADKNVNIEAGNNIHLKAAGDNTAGTVAAIPSVPGQPPRGTGGNLRLEAAGDLSQFASLNVQTTAAGGSYDLNTAGDVNLTAGGPAGVNVLAASGPVRIQSTNDTSILSAAEFNVTSARNTSISSPLILLNSGGSPAVSAEPALLSPRIGTNKFSDAGQNPPTFDRNAALNGQNSATSAGQRTGAKPTINSIVSVMPTAEPYVGHYQVTQTDILNAIPAPSIDLLAALPPGVGNDLSRPADVNSPAGFKQGAAYVDQNGNSVTTNLTSAIPTYTPLDVRNNFKVAAEQRILEINNLNGLVSGLRNSLPVIRTPTTTPLNQLMIGAGQILSDIEQQLSRFAVSTNAVIQDLQQGAAKQISNAITSIQQTATSAADFAAKLAAEGIQVISDGTSRIFKKDDIMIVDLSTGIGEIGTTLGLTSQLNSSYQQISKYITSPVSENQALALSSFAQSIGAENFANSNVLEALNKQDYASIPRLMQSWSLAQSPSGQESISLSLQGRRQWESSVFQSPDEINIDVMNNSEASGLSFSELAQMLDIRRSDYLASLTS